MATNADAQNISVHATAASGNQAGGVFLLIAPG